MARNIRELLHCDAGATAIEYGMIAGMVAEAIITVVPLAGESLREFLQRLAESL